MDFCRLTTVYDAMRRLKRFGADETPEQFYASFNLNLGVQAAISGRADKAFDLNQGLAEKDWYAAGCPYYKVWPRMVDEFALTNLDVPVDCLNAPYNAFAVYLPDEPIIDFEWATQRHWVRNMLVRFTDRAYVYERRAIQEARTMTVWYDIGEQDPMLGLPIQSYRIVRFFLAPTIEKCLDKNRKPSPGAEVGVQVPWAVSDALVRLAVAVCFLATGASKVMEADIIKKHLDAYRREPEGSLNRKRWEEKSRRLGLTGWHIGRNRSDRRLNLVRGVSYAQAMREDGLGRHLIYQHQQGGHFRRIKIGEGRKSVMVKWIDETTHRPDLPPRPMPVKETA